MRLKPSDTFRRNLALVIEDRGMTIQCLADLARTHRPNMSRILSGHEHVSLERAGRIAKGLDIPLCDLLDVDFRIPQEIS